MLELKTKKELSQYSHTLARGFELVQYKGQLYRPVDFETGENDPTPEPLRTSWDPLGRDDLRRFATEQFNILFANDAELKSFVFMVMQNSKEVRATRDTLLLRTEDGLRELRGDGQLHEPTGQFVANTLVPTLNTDPIEKARVFEVIAGWLDSEDEAHSVLKHFATALAPGWSAVKYVLLMGEGRNGKSLLLKMLKATIGGKNVSSVTRQAIAEESPTVPTLNGKLLNLVFDGKAEYVKDSGMEKSLIAGEEVPIRRLYESDPTLVQTNALFVEGLQHEPKSTDKSLALQKRLVRYQFPNVYPLDLQFEDLMLGADSLGAFLALLLDHYVTKGNVAKELAPSQKAMELQLEHMVKNSLGLQFLKYLDESDPLGVDGLMDTSITELTQRFQAWRIKENDVSVWNEPDVATLFQPVLSTDRKSMRVNGTPRKVRVVTGLKPEAEAFLETLKGDEDDDRELLEQVREDH